MAKEENPLSLQRIEQSIFTIRGLQGMPDSDLVEDIRPEMLVRRFLHAHEFRDWLRNINQMDFLQKVPKSGTFRKNSPFPVNLSNASRHEKHHFTASFHFLSGVLWIEGPGSILHGG